MTPKILALIVERRREKKNPQKYKELDCRFHLYEIQMQKGKGRVAFAET